MADAQDDSQPAGDEIQLAPEKAVTPARTDMTVAEMRQWLRNWIADATGQSADAINDSTPMVELGLSSRDAVAMASDIEDLTGVTLTATVAFRHPTIESLATVIIEGEPEIEDTGEDEDWTRARDVDDIAIVGIATRFPGDMNTPDETWQALLEGRDAITDLPEGRWEEFLGEPRIAERVAKARTRGGYLTDIKGFDAEFFALSKMEADNIDPQQRMALELTWEALENARIPASSLRGESVAVYIGSSLNDYSFLAMSDPSIAHPYAITGTASSIIANRVSYFYDFRGPSVAIDTACSSSLVAAHQGVQALEGGRGRRGDRRRRERIDHAAGDGRLRRGRRRARAGRPDQVVLAGRRRLRPLRGRRHAGAQAALRRPARRRRDPRGDRGQRGQPRRPVQRPARAEPGRAGRGAAQGVQGRRHQSTRRRLHRGARHRHHPG